MICYTGIAAVDYVCNTTAHRLRLLLSYCCFSKTCAAIIQAQVSHLPFRWQVSDENLACGLCYTSGTTGNPKVTNLLQCPTLMEAATTTTDATSTHYSTCNIASSTLWHQLAAYAVLAPCHAMGRGLLLKLWHIPESVHGVNTINSDMYISALTCLYVFLCPCLLVPLPLLLHVHDSTYKTDSEFAVGTGSAVQPPFKLPACLDSSLHRRDEARQYQLHLCSCALVSCQLLGLGLCRPYDGRPPCSAR